MRDSVRRDAHRLWRRCWADAKASFGQPRVALLQQEIATMLARHGGAGGEGEDGEGGEGGKGEGGEGKGGENETGEINHHAAILPADPARLLSPANAVVVDLAARRELLRACRAGGRDRYMTVLAQMCA